MKNYLEIRQIFFYFVSWRIVLFVVAMFAIYFIPVFGNRFPYADTALEITGLPNWVWGFGNFDGVHYLRIAQNGYNSEYTEAFFPLFPFLIRLFSKFIPKNLSLDTDIFVDPAYFYSGLLLSNLIFLAGLIFVYKLYKIDNNKNTSFLSVILLLAFPVSFYFGAIYTESLFLFLAAGSLYFARKGKFLVSGVFASLASATKIIGILLIFALIIEFYLQKKKNDVKNEAIVFLSFLIAPLGLFIYMLYLNEAHGDPLYFLSAQPGFGAERSAIPLVPYPQVIYRYFKMLFSVDLKSLHFFNILSEFIFGTIPFVLIFLLYKNIRLSYLVFIFIALLVPTLTGTFSSMPRYSLVLFPIFPLIVSSLSKTQLKLLSIVCVILQFIYLSLFIRGYWIA